MALPERKKLRKLAELEGFETVTELLEHACRDSISPGICMNDGCDYTSEYEPDQTEGWCEVCDTNTVKSALVLAGII